MDDESEQRSDSNRNKKVDGRAKRRKYVQGTRAYTHAMTNSMAKRAARVEDGEAAERNDR
jgi:hypothetical protein